MSDPTLDEQIEYAPEQLEQVLQENAYLRELLGQLEGIAHENIELMKRVAELEARIELEPAAQDKAAQAATIPAKMPAAVRTAGTALADLATVIAPAGDGQLPVLIVGPSHVDVDRWNLFSLGELTDLCFGMPDKTAIRYVSGPVTTPAQNDLDFLGKTYGLQSVQVDAGASTDEVDAKNWQLAVTALVESFRPRVVLMLNPDRKQAPLIPALSALGAKVVLRCARNELNDLIGTDFRLPLAQQQEIIEAFAASSLVLATSHWEREQLDAVSGQRIPTEIYVPGVDLNYFGDVARETNPFVMPPMT
jgi:hypothetical protein